MVKNVNSIKKFRLENMHTKRIGVHCNSEQCVLNRCEDAVVLVADIGCRYRVY